MMVLILQIIILFLKDLMIIRDTYKIPVYTYVTHTTFLIPSVFQWFWTCCEVLAYIILHSMQYYTNTQKCKLYKYYYYFFADKREYILSDTYSIYWWTSDIILPRIISST